MSEHVLPFYVVCDESYSMVEHLDTLNAGVRDLHHVATTDRRVAGKVRLCLMGFSGAANVLVPLSKPTELTQITGMTAKAATNFGAAFALLRETIESDVRAMNTAAHVVYRPVVFFLSDGLPTDPASWRAAHDRLTENSWPARPHIIAFGIGDADAQTIKRVGTFKTFMSDSGMTPGAVVRKFAKELTTSIVMSDNSDSRADIIFPEASAGLATAYAGQNH